MAREGQGLQILVIVFVFLTMILAFGTWYGISNWATSVEKLEAKDVELAAEKKLRQQYTTEADIYRFMVDFDPLTEETYLDQLNRLSTSPDTDPTIKERVTEVSKEFNTDMDKIAASTDGEKNWRVLAEKLLDVVAQKNKEVAVMKDETTRLLALQISDKAAFDKALAIALKAAEQYLADLDKANRQAAVDKTNLQNALTDAQTKLDAQGKETEKVQRTLTAQVNSLKNNVDALEQQVLQQALVIREMQPDEIEVPDGKITLSSPSSKTVYINLGSADNLRPQISFAVYGPNETKFVPENKKGDIQVERIDSAHMAACRIINTSINDPILAGDFVHTPTWTPSRRLQFALAGFFDMDGDQINDQNWFKSILSANNGDVVAELTEKGKEEGELTPRIRYVIIGDEPSDPAMLTKFGTYVQGAEKTGLEVRHYRDVLEQMGVRVEARASKPGREGGNDAFKPRRPTRGATGSAYLK